MNSKTDPSLYRKRRAGMVYYAVVERLATQLATGAGSVIDVGSWDTPCLEWFSPDIKRYSLDLRKPLQAEGVISIKADFLKWEPAEQFDIAMCLQVLEHVPDARSFAQKLLSIAKTVIVSVPYKWKEGKVKYHVHDPVDEAKLESWFGRKPHYQYICREIRTVERRLICVYEDPAIPAWRSTYHRSSLMKT